MSSSQKSTMTDGARIVVVVALDDPEDADDDDGSVQDDTSFLEQARYCCRYMYKLLSNIGFMVSCCSR
jgi:hypothetical protein